jgi:hypothetical protein
MLSRLIWEREREKGLKIGICASGGELRIDQKAKASDRPWRFVSVGVKRQTNRIHDSRAGLCRLMMKKRIELNWMTLTLYRAMT